MTTLDWLTFRQMAREALDAELCVVGHTDGRTYLVDSRRPEHSMHRVSIQGHVTNCSCELSALGNKPCPHGALAWLWAAWQRAEVRG